MVQMKRIKRKIEETDVSLNRVCTDTSALIAGKITELMNAHKLDGSEIIIPEVVTGELQAQAAKGKEIGFVGLEEIKKIQQAKEKPKSNN
jgi:ATPase